jgi:hypothetical protein
MLSFVMVLALAAAGDGGMCDGRMSASLDEYALAADEYGTFDADEAEAVEAEAYAAAEIDFASSLEELGLQGSTLGREQSVARARSGRALAGIEGLSQLAVPAGVRALPSAVPSRNR